MGSVNRDSFFGGDWEILIMRMPPKVSILIPTYNYAHFLPEALNSILMQNFQDYEVIISDDASTDNTIEVVRLYLEKDSRIKFFKHEKNIGMVENWNWCLNNSQGEYIKYLFADDLLESVDALTEFVKLLDENPSAALAVSARYFINEQSENIGFVDELKCDGLVKGGEVIKACLLRDKNLIGEPSVVMFRKAFSVRGFDSEYRQLVDLEMWFSLCLEHDLIYTNQPLCCFRRHSGQQTEVNSKLQRTKFEGVQLFQSYFPKLNQCKSVNVGSFERYRMLFMQIKSIKKKGGLHGAKFRNISEFGRLLPVYWYFLCLLQYRFVRIVENLCRLFRRRRNKFLQ